MTVPCKACPCCVAWLAERQEWLASQERFYKKRQDRAGRAKAKSRRDIANLEARIRELGGDYHDLFRQHIAD